MPSTIYLYGVKYVNTHIRGLNIRPCVGLSILCLKKVLTFKLSVILPNLNRFSKFCTAGNRMKFATKPTLLTSRWALCYTTLGN